MSDDWEYSDNSCPKCSSDLAYRTCYTCGGDGYVEDDEDEWYSEERCDTCNGMGHEEWCRECGWDMNFNCFMSSEYERVYNEKCRQESSII